MTDNPKHDRKRWLTNFDSGRIVADGERISLPLYLMDHSKAGDKAMTTTSITYELADGNSATLVTDAASAKAIQHLNDRITSLKGQLSAQCGAVAALKAKAAGPVYDAADSASRQQFARNFIHDGEKSKEAPHVQALANAWQRKPKTAVTDDLGRRRHRCTDEAREEVDHEAFSEARAGG